MTTAVDFSQLTDAVNDAQGKVKGAANRTRSDLQAQVQQAQQGAEAKAQQIKAHRAESKDKAAADWQAFKDRWHNHLQHLHRMTDDRKAEMDQRKAEHKAEAAEGYADDAVSFAVAAVQEAEYAVLEAALARADANTAASNG
jgi:hypothetical protein